MAPDVCGDRLGLVIGHSFDLVHQAASLGREVHHRTVEVPAGPDGHHSTAVDLVDLDGVVALARHGRSEFTPAHHLDHHAHVRALCAAGVDRVVGLASTGSLRAGIPVGSVVIPDDWLAPGVAPTFHVDAAGHRVPGFDAPWRSQVVDAWCEATVAATPGARPPLLGGTYAQTTGPRFETPAEVRLLATFADVVGMTLVGEAVLAGEAGLRYAAVCTVDNLANGVGGSELHAEHVAEGMAQSRTHVAEVLRHVLEVLAAP